MIIQLTVDVSLASESITKLVPATIEPTGADRFPKVPPGVFLVSNMIEFAVTAVVGMVIVPGVPESAADVPTEALAPVAIDSLLPAVLRTKSPSVAVISPRVAVRVVPAVTDPAVTPKLPVVTVRPVPAVIVVVAESDVVVVSEPGAVIAAGRDHVIVDPAPVVVIWLAVPATVILPDDGLIAPPEPPVRVATADDDPPSVAHVAVPAAMLTRPYILPPDVSTKRAPIPGDVKLLDGAAVPVKTAAAFCTWLPP